MAELVEVKVRPVGNALGVILPGEVVRENKLQSGETVLLSVLKKRRVRASEVFATLKNLKPFEREHAERVV